MTQGKQKQRQNEMARDWKLDKATHDLALVNGDLAFVDDQEEVAQCATIRLWFIEAEYELDYTLGTPWFDVLFAISDRLIKEQTLRGRLKGTPGVTRVKNFTYSIDPQEKGAAVTFNLETIFGGIEGAI
jgi:hypothetical protein